MAHFYDLVFSLEEATYWIPGDTDKEQGLQKLTTYTIYSEEVDGETVKYIFNDREEKMYDVWNKFRGDFAT